MGQFSYLRKSVGQFSNLGVGQFSTLGVGQFMCPIKQRFYSDIFAKIWQGDKSCTNIRGTFTPNFTKCDGDTSYKTDEDSQSLRETCEKTRRKLLWCCKLLSNICTCFVYITIFFSCFFSSSWLALTWGDLPVLPFCCANLLLFFCLVLRTCIVYYYLLCLWLLWSKVFSWGV